MDIEKNYQLIDPKLSKSNILWRFMDLSKFLALLEERKLFLCRPDAFHDKFEGSFTNSIKKAIEKAYKEHDIEFTYDKFKRCLHERVFINCWHNSKYDSMAMWNLYGKSTNSLAITTTVGKLSSQLLRSEFVYHLYIKKVEYIEHWNDPDIEINPYSHIFSYKVKAYEYEKEVRVILDRYAEMFEKKTIPNSVSIELNLDELLRSIVISPEAPEWFFQLLNKISKRYDLKCPVERSQMALDPL